MSIAEKKEFIDLLKTLPYKGEFFTDDAVKTAGPYLPVLFALTEKDIETYDIAPFAVISRELCDDKERRRHALVTLLRFATRYVSLPKTSSPV
jgi:hypothetical protein